VPRDAFEGYDEPLNSDMDPEDALKLVMDPDKVEDPAEDVIEPKLDG
jgi:hypothetical protein